jgi:hypothetical protein
MRAIACAVAALIAGSAHAQTVIYDTFNADEQNLFDCCNVLDLHGKPAAPKFAVPFSPEADARVIGVDVALSFFSGPLPRFDVRLYGSQDGLPGRVKHHFQARDIPAGGQCCQYVTIRLRDAANGIVVKAGGHYWIEVNAESTDTGGWNLNSLGMSGPYATQIGSKGEWTMTEGPLPAVRVIAK